MNNLKNWFGSFKHLEEFSYFNSKPVAYFCAEYALTTDLPIYAGGLGVLAGDYVREAYESGFPLVAIGLLYKEKYRFDFNGYKKINPFKYDLKPVVDKSGQRIKVSIPIGDRKVFVQAWLNDSETAPVYLLDTDVDENESEDRLILNSLYETSRDLRFKQEMILGIAGVRFLKRLGIEPSLYHMNEGHSALLVFEVARMIMENEKVSFSEALNRAKGKIAFTNHTLVMGAHDVFASDLFNLMLSSYSNELGIPIFDLLTAGLVKDTNSFSTTILALKSAGKSNGVSKFHATKANEIWKDHPVSPITNGVSISRWDMVKTSNKTSMMDIHRRNKNNLLEYIRKETDCSWNANDLIVGWARRIVGYKRPVCFFDDFERALKLLNNEDMPLRLVFAGHPHINDGEGLWLLERLRSLSQNELKGKLIFLERYSTEFSNLLVSGCDVWLNTPVVGLEACGTSTMKASLNGSLLCSTNDGWIKEIDLPKVGFVVENDNISDSLLSTFESEILPMYYSDQDDWKSKMVHSREAILENFSTKRMLYDYITQMYEPLIKMQNDL